LTPTPLPTPTPAFISYTTPDWFKNAVLYQIFVRSFADSDGDGIGDFNGITANLDYIQSLGADVIWLMPIHPSPSDHGYDVTDYFAVNPDYGTMADFQLLVDEVHKRDMRILIDFVASHLSVEHEFFQDAFGNPNSPYDDWFHFTNEANTSYQSFANIGNMPRFNHFNPEVVDYLSEVALFWMDPDQDGDTTDGVDGYRVDNAIFPPNEFFVTLRQRVKRANPDALLLGEVWVSRSKELRPFFQDQFDALFNFPLYTLASGDPEGNGDGLLAGVLPASLLTRILSDQRELFPPEAILVQFFSNHDTNRLASELEGDVAREKMAAALSALLPGTVAIYYGEEIGMPGVKGGPPAWDNYRREPMDWYAAETGPQMTTWFRPPDRWNRPDDGISVEEQEADPDSLLNTYRAVLSLKKTLPALREGDFEVLETTALGRKAWAARRTAGEQTLIAIFNFGTETTEITVAGFPFTSPTLTDLLSGETYPGSTAGGDYVITLPPAGVVWFLSGE